MYSERGNVWTEVNFTECLLSVFFHLLCKLSFWEWPTMNGKIPIAPNLSKISTNTNFKNLDLKFNRGKGYIKNTNTDTNTNTNTNLNHSDLKFNWGKAGTKGATVLHKQGKTINIHKSLKYANVQINKCKMFKCAKLQM